MGYASLQECITDLDKHGHLVRIEKEVDPNLEMAAIHRRVYRAEGPAIYFANVKGSPFPAVSNLFGTLERSHFMFRDTLESVKKLVHLRGNPMIALSDPLGYAGTPFLAWSSLPKRVRSGPALQNTTQVSQLPQIKSWPMDGGSFITLPQVYTEDIDNPGVMKGNLGMYRIQMAGNEYNVNDEVGLHYQIHRGIGVHQTKAHQKGEPMKVSVFVGGSPAHNLAAVMPLPEGISELTFAGALGNRRFRYTKRNGYVISTDADFVITGTVYPQDNKPEGPFGDHLGYYSLQHPFPVMHVDNVYYRKGAIWPFTVVGRPPQEDTSFGQLIHEITGDVVPQEIPGLHEVHAVDASGVHPLLLAIGSERYTPYYENQPPQELLTIANSILGFGQMSLAKYLWIAARGDNNSLDTHDIQGFFGHILERVDWKRDLHFHTKTTIDTLDYSGSGLNKGSKVVIAAVGDSKRSLATELPDDLDLPDGFSNPRIAMPGIMVVKGPTYNNEDTGEQQAESLCQSLDHQGLATPENWPLIVIADDSQFTAKNERNFIWITFTRSNPSHDIHGVNSFIDHKHWGCTGPLVIDARQKPHHAPPLDEDPEIEKRVDELGKKGGPLENII